jgi:succinoglycan biosynthesis transport protein ExoP
MTGRQPDLDDLGGEPRSFDLRDYAQIIRRHVVLIVVLTVLGAIAAAGYAMLSGHKYAATAQVLVTSATQGSSSSSSAQQLATQANMTTEEAIAQSPPVVLQAAKLLHVPASALQAAAAKRLTVNVPASTLATSNVLQITWQAKKPAAAQAGADAFANAYLSYRRQLLASQVNSQTASLSQQLASVEQQITKIHTQLNRTPTSPLHQSLALKLKQLVSEQAAYNNKLASLSVANSSVGSLIPAARPLAASGLSHKLYLVLGGLLGLLIGLVLAFVVDVFDDRIRDAAQFEQKLGAPTLAMLPPGASLIDPENQAAEAVHTLRAMLAGMAARRQLRTLLVVAADASVSTSELAAGLGVALAESRRLVLLVAADLRGSILPQIFDVPSDPGLSDVLVDGSNPKGLMRKPRQVAGMLLPGQVARQLAVLPQGPQLAYALAALDSHAMQELLHDVREVYDFVLLDSPSATVAGDAYALAANVDGVIVAAKERHTKGRAVEELSRRLDRIGAVVVGGVLIGKGRAGGHRQRPPRAEPSRGVEQSRDAPVVAAEGRRARL